LEEQFTVLLCNARHIKHVPGRKTDVTDCEWIAQLLQCGLLSGSFIPPRAQRDLRDLTRRRAQLTGEATRAKNRIQKVLEDANVKLGTVASDPLGVSGRLMLRALVAGPGDPAQLAGLARGRLRAKKSELREALHGHVTEHHRFLLGRLLRHLEFLEQEIEELTRRIEAMMASTDPAPPQGGCPRDEAPAAPEAVPSLDAAAPAPVDPPPAVPAPMGFLEAVAWLDPIPGIDEVSAQALVAELGTNMGQFRTAKSLTSWARLCPGNDESAGKRKSGRTGKGNRWLRRVLVQCAWAASRTKGSYFGAQYRQIAKRRGKKRAIVAVAHSLLIVIYQMLKHHTAYDELGADFFDKIDPIRKTRYHVRRLEELA